MNELVYSMGYQDNINEISKTSSPDLEIQDMMTIDLHNISMCTTYGKTVKVGIRYPVH